MQKSTIKKIIVWTLIILLIAWSIFLFYIDVNTVIASIGIENTYVILFLVAAVSGTSFLTSASFYVVYLAYVHADLHPLTLGIVGGLGMSIGDSLFFFLSRTAGDVMNLSKNKTYKKLFAYISRLPHWGVYIFTYLYASFSPFPNDILMVALGVLRFRYSRIIPIIIIGNITLLTLVAAGISFF